jgi:hypothetical protein
MSDAMPRWPPQPKGEAAMMKRADGAWARLHQGETLQFRLIFAAIFLVFLVAAALARVLPRQWRMAGGDRSIFGEARTAAATFAPFAFMG